MAASSYLEHLTYNVALSKREVALLSGWERERRKYLTTEDVRRAVGKSVAPTVTSSLARKGVLERIGRGVYLVRPFSSLLHPTSSSAPMVAAALLHAEPYYLGGLWALTQHGLTSQQYASTLDAFVARPHRTRSLAGAKVVFHDVGPSAMEYGISETKIEEVTVRMSDSARTLVDLLDHPKLAGGLRQAVTLFVAELHQVEASKIVEYAARGSRPATCQRLGVLLERAHVPQSVLSTLKTRMEGPRPLTSLIPGPRTGHVNPRWNVLENDIGLDPSAAP